MTVLAIPVKGLFQVKTRLSGLCSPEERRQICLDMLRHMLRAARACPLVDAAAVISPDQRLKALLEGEFPGIRFLLEAGGLNQAALAASRVLAGEGYSSMLFALGDLPLLTAGEMEQALRLGQRHPLVLLPDRHGTGTNGMVLSPPDCLPAFSFGEGSLAAHLAAARALGLAPVELRLPGFGWDVDTPEDLGPILDKRSKTI